MVKKSKKLIWGGFASDGRKEEFGQFKFEIRVKGLSRDKFDEWLGKGSIPSEEPKINTTLEENRGEEVKLFLKGLK